MSVRQYIGARYVLKVYENTLDPSSPEWQASVNYEPLTLVTYNNGSYISKKDVPASVGNPADNPTYWAQNGSYNGQIANLQNQINDINTLVSQLYTNTKNVILIGDSYLDPSAWTWDSYGEVFDDHINGDVYIYGESASGFCSAGMSGHTFNDLLSLAYGSHTSDANSITDVICIGGSNDRSHVNDIESDMTIFITNAKTYFPNAKIIIGFCGFVDTNNNSDKLAFNNALAEYKKCTGLGASYITNMEYLMHNYDDYTADHGHPGESLQKRIGNFLYEWYTSGSANDELESSPSITWNTGTFDLITNVITPEYWVPHIKTQHFNGISLFQIIGNRSELGFYDRVALDTPAGLSQGLMKMADISGGCYYGTEATALAEPSSVQFPIGMNIGADLKMAMASIFVVNKQLFLTVLGVDNVTLANVDRIWFSSVTITTNTLYA